MKEFILVIEAIVKAILIFSNLPDFKCVTPFFIASWLANASWYYFATTLLTLYCCSTVQFPPLPSQVTANGQQAPDTRCAVVHSLHGCSPGPPALAGPIWAGCWTRRTQKSLDGHAVILCLSWCRLTSALIQYSPLGGTNAKAAFCSLTKYAQVYSCIRFEPWLWKLNLK